MLTVLSELPLPVLDPVEPELDPLELLVPLDPVDPVELLVPDEPVDPLEELVVPLEPLPEEPLLDVPLPEEPLLLDVPLPEEPLLDVPLPDVPLPEEPLLPATSAPPDELVVAVVVPVRVVAISSHAARNRITAPATTRRRRRRARCARVGRLGDGLARRGPWVMAGLNELIGVIVDFLLGVVHRVLTPSIKRVRDG